MTTEQKAKAYDEALRIAQELYNNPNSSNIGKGYIYAIFPELKESEDEKIKKELIDAVQGLWDNDALPMPLSAKRKDAWIAWLEKQGEQKPIDNVQPKFHEGEWITNGDYTWKIVEVKPLDYILQSQDGNIVDDTISHVDEQFHSFTIKDAKDGDVLVYKDEISLYKHDIKNCTKQETTFGGFVYHCCYDGKRFIIDSLYSLTEQDKIDIHPATKKQRDLLFKKMHEARYMWDSGSKQLLSVKAEPNGTRNPAWSRENDKQYDGYINWLKSLKQRIGG